MKSFKSFLAVMAGIAAGFPRYFDNSSFRTEWNLEKRAKGIRNPKDPVKKAAIERRHKRRKLAMLSKPKRRAAYYYNLHHPVKMFKAECMYI